MLDFPSRWKTSNKMKRTLGVVIAIACISWLTFSMAPSSANAEEPIAQKAVLVTGASSGIGRKITEKLASEGVFVYAGARKDADIAALNEIENVLAVRLDVTVQAQIDEAVKTVADGGRGLYAVVNNAGVNVMGPLIEIEESELDFLFDVNIYGPYRVTKAFAPMIIESKGRISNISSISGTLSGGLYGIYAMSKHALEAYTDALAREMQIFDVKVSAVEPGNYKTQIFHSRCDRLMEQGNNPETSRYTDFVTRMYETCKERPVDTDPEPDQVADAVYHALFDENPKEHYMVVPAQEQAGWTIGKAVEELVSLNQGHEFSYSREQLIEMLDAEIARQDALVAVE
jgi:NAD(P)-dependent dehydrogenase (short-subunit alcohol dehydrogenase family)